MEHARACPRPGHRGDADPSLSVCAGGPRPVGDFEDLPVGEWRVAEITFVTTNYDLLIELAAIGNGIWTVPTDDILAACKRPGGFDAVQIYWPEAKHKVRIVKLHGSANWYDFDGQLFAYSNYDIDNGPAPGRHCERWQTDICSSADMSKCLMIPPAVIKPNLYPKLASQWRAGAEAIATADALWFIGYSFPESDSFMQFFLASSLFNNARIKQLAVIDPSSAACKRAKALFRLPSLAQIFVKYPFPWQQINYANLLAGNYLDAMEDWSIKHLQHSEIKQQIILG